MATRKRQRREYLRLLDKSMEAAECAIDNFNRVKAPFKTEAALMLLAVSWELLAKSLLVKAKQSIRKGRSSDTISGEVAISKLLHMKIIEKRHSDISQQIISLRNAAVHDVLPPIPLEVLHHLMFYACKFHRQIIVDHYKAQSKGLQAHYLSLSFEDMTTFADKIQKCVSKMKRNAADKQLVWLLERGLRFDGSKYITESQFDVSIRGKKRTMPKLEMGRFLKETDMVKIVPVEAPKNYSVDVKLRKGDVRDSTLPILTKRTEIEIDYPYLTTELGEAIGKNMNYTAKAISVLGLKGNEKFHQEIRSSKSGVIHRYSEPARTKIEQKIAEDPDFNPYKYKKP